MRRRGDFGTLAERAARSGGPAPAPAPAPPVPAVPIRHCWVVGVDGTLPALLLGWEHRASGWWGRVVHPVSEPDGRWAVVEEWLPAERLRPA
jgi:hypothetical protein